MRETGPERRARDPEPAWDGQWDPALEPGAARFVPTRRRKVVFVAVSITVLLVSLVAMCLAGHEFLGLIANQWASIP